MPNEVIQWFAGRLDAGQYVLVLALAPFTRGTVRILREKFGIDRILAGQALSWIALALSVIITLITNFAMQHIRTGDPVNQDWMSVITMSLCVWIGAMGWHDFRKHRENPDESGRESRAE